MSLRLNLKPIVASTLIALAAFAAGWASGSSAFATYINNDLAMDLNAIGQDFFGTAIFAVYQPDDPLPPGDPVRLDFGDNSQFPIALNVFHHAEQADPRAVACRSYLKVVITGGKATLYVNKSAVPGGTVNIQYVDLPDVGTTSQCSGPV